VTHHSNIGAIIIGIDPGWCDPDMPLSHPFPFWLYGGTAEYLTHLLNPSALIRVVRRLRLALGLATRADPTGYWDYEAGRPSTFLPGATARPFVDLRTREPLQTDNAALDLIEPTLSTLSQRTKVVFVAPPQFYDALPQAQSAAAVELVRCKQEFLRRSITHGWEFLDFLVDNEMVHDPANFMDNEHYRSSIARLIEHQIATKRR